MPLEKRMRYRDTKKRIGRLCARFVIAAFLLSVCPVSSGWAAEGAAKAAEGARLITLPQGIEIVLKDSRLIKIALLDNEMAFRDSLLGRSALLPQLSAQAAQTYYRYQPASRSGGQEIKTSDKEFASYGLNVYQTLFDFGKSLSTYLASKEAMKARKANTESVRRVSVLEFIAAYFNVLEAGQFIGVYEKELESLSAYLNDIEHLYEQGAAVKNDLLPARVRLADTRQKLITARNARDTAAARLNNILALPLRQKVALEDIALQPLELPELENAWNTARTERPEIAFYDEQIKVSVLSERSKAAENLPVIFANGSYTYGENSYQVHEDNAALTLGAKVNLYDGGAAQASLQKERALQRQLVEQKNKITDDIQLEVEDSYLGLKDSCEKVAVAKDALEQAGENARVYRTRYATGSATSTEVLEAIAMQTRSEANYYSADYELKRSYARFLYSMGVDLALIYGKMESVKNDRTSQQQ